MSLRRPMLALVAASLLAAGCGDEAPTRQEFAQSANQICNDLEKAGREIPQPKTTQDLQRFVDATIRTVDDGVKKFKALEVPEGEDGEVADRFVKSVEKDANEKLKPALGELKRAANKRDPAAITQAGDKIENTETPETDRLARQLGANACAE